MKIGVLFSSGKDSVNTVWYYSEQGWDITCLLSLLPENPDSYMFQNPHEEILLAQSKSLGIPLLVQKTRGEKESELDDLKKLLLQAKNIYGVVGIAVGALASDYQEERVNRICHEVGLKTYAPLWHKNQENLLREMIRSGFDIRMTRIAADGLNETWLGETLREKDIDRLLTMQKSHGVAIGGEGGEFETITLNGPIFSQAIDIQCEKHMESECRGELRIHHVQLK